MEQTCHTCTKSYMGADGELRCRLNALRASKPLWESCGKYEREPGTEEPDQPWLGGRGD